MRIRIRFRVTRSDEATVQVIRAGRATWSPRSPASSFLKRYHFFTFYWDGRNRAGERGARPAATSCG